MTARGGAAAAAIHAGKAPASCATDSPGADATVSALPPAHSTLSSEPAAGVVRIHFATDHQHAWADMTVAGDGTTVAVLLAAMGPASTAAADERTAAALTDLRSA